MTRETLLALKSIIDEMTSDQRDRKVSIIEAMSGLSDSEQFSRINNWLRLFRTKTTNYTGADIFKLGEIAGTIETLLTIEEKQK